MHVTEPQQKCKIVTKITNRATFYCLKPAEVALVLNVPEHVLPLLLCVECARNLGKEILDSLPASATASVVRPRVVRQ